MFGHPTDPIQYAPGMGPNRAAPPTTAPAQQAGPAFDNNAQAVRPNNGTPNMPGVGQFDPSYLQNLATYIGGLFQRPASGAESFNPLGNLSDMYGVQSVGAGNAPTQGLPPTMLQNAINANLAQQPSQAPAPAAPLTPEQMREQRLQQKKKQQAIGLGSVDIHPSIGDQSMFGGATTGT